MQSRDSGSHLTPNPSQYRNTWPLSLEPGRVILNYEVIEKVGSGGQAIVWKARHIGLKRYVALKVVHFGCETSSTATLEQGRPILVRFQREMESLGRMNHPNVVGVFDATIHDGLLILVLELCDGKSLSDLLKSKGPLQVADVCEVARQTAMGLQHATERGVVHCDIKPHNLILTRTGLVKIVDWGIACFENDRSSNPFGFDTRSDLYSLGSTMFQLLTGRAEFTGAEYETREQILHAKQFDTAPGLTQFRPDAPLALEQLVARLLAKNPMDRGDSPNEIARLLIPFCSGSRLDNLIDGNVNDLPTE